MTHEEFIRQMSADLQRAGLDPANYLRSPQELSEMAAFRDRQLASFGARVVDEPDGRGFFWGGFVLGSVTTAILLGLIWFVRSIA